MAAEEGASLSGLDLLHRQIVRLAGDDGRRRRRRPRGAAAAEAAGGGPAEDAEAEEGDSVESSSDSDEDEEDGSGSEPAAAAADAADAAPGDGDAASRPSATTGSTGTRTTGALVSFEVAAGPTAASAGRRPDDRAAQEPAPERKRVAVYRCLLPGLGQGDDVAVREPSPRRSLPQV